MCKFYCGVSRATLWVTWLVCTVVAAVYAALSLRTFVKVNEAYSDAPDANNQTVAVLVATFAGASLVVAFSVVCFLLLLGKQVSSSAVGYMYGFINASSLNLALLCLLCGLVLTAFEDDINTGFSNRSPEEGEDLYDWSSTDTDVFKATYWFAFITAAGYFGLFLVMFLASFTIDRQNSLMEEERGG